MGILTDAQKQQAQSGDWGGLIQGAFQRGTSFNDLVQDFNATYGTNATVDSAKAELAKAGYSQQNLESDLAGNWRPAASTTGSQVPQTRTWGDLITTHPSASADFTNFYNGSGASSQYPSLSSAMNVVVPQSDYDALSSYYANPTQAGYDALGDEPRKWVTPFSPTTRSGSSGVSQVQTPESPSATNAQASNWTVDPNTMTVSGQIQNLLAQNSPVMQMARTHAREDANARGTLNSSMAEQAGEAAAIQSALPIAAQDASTYTTAAQSNSNLNTQVNLANAGATNQAALTAYQGGLQAALADSSARNQVVFKSLDANNQQSLLGLQTKYQKQLNGSQYAAALYSNAMTQLSAILQDPNMDAASKQNSVNQIVSSLGTFLDMNAATTGLVDNILTPYMPK